MSAIHVWGKINFAGSSSTSTNPSCSLHTAFQKMRRPIWLPTLISAGGHRPWTNSRLLSRLFRGTSSAPKLTHLPPGAVKLVPCADTLNVWTSPVTAADHRARLRSKAVEAGSTTLGTHRWPILRSKSTRFDTALLSSYSTNRINRTNFATLRVTRVRRLATHCALRIRVEFPLVRPAPETTWKCTLIIITGRPPAGS